MISLAERLGQQQSGVMYIQSGEPLLLIWGGRGRKEVRISCAVGGWLCEKMLLFCDVEGWSNSGPAEKFAARSLQPGGALKLWVGLRSWQPAGEWFARRATVIPNWSLLTFDDERYCRLDLQE